MKEIFIGSSKEALEQATQVAAVLSEAKDVKPLLWTECFKLGDITFLGIENILTVPLTSPVSSVGDSPVRSEATFTPRHQASGIDRKNEENYFWPLGEMASVWERKDQSNNQLQERNPSYVRTR